MPGLQDGSDAFRDFVGKALKGGMWKKDIGVLFL
jgi:hypothetical protein